MIRLARTRLVIEYAAFESLRRSLLEQLQPESLEKPLAFWARTGDRTLPLALMNRTICELLTTPFEELSATRGVGAKKIGGLLQLLGRVAEPTSATAGSSSLELAAPLNVPRVATLPQIEVFPASAMPSEEYEESLWSQWRESVDRLGLANETLGRFAPSLADLPRTLWTVRLGNYLPLRLAEVRALRAHGEKRMKGVLEIFAAIHRSVSKVEPADHLAISVWPSRVLQLDHWARATARTQGFPSIDEVQRHFVEPMVEQLRIDAGPELAQWTARQLEVPGATATVPRADSSTGTSQPSGFYLRKMAAIIAVRWPEGESHVPAIQGRLTDFQLITPAVRLFQAAAGMFYPGVAAGLASNSAVTNELFQWPRHPSSAAAHPGSSVKQTQQTRPRNVDTVPLRDERSSGRTATMRYAEPGPNLSPTASS